MGFNLVFKGLKGLWYLLDMRMCGIYSQSGHYGDKKNLCPAGNQM